MIIELPTDPPALKTVAFVDTTFYHWPQFNLNVTDVDGNAITENFTEVNGPQTFKKAIGLNNEYEEV